MKLSKLKTVLDKIETVEASDDLKEFVTLACDTFGVEPEYHSEHSLVLKPTEHMFTHAFPEVGDDGLTVTFDRRHLVRMPMLQLVGMVIKVLD